MNLLHAYGGIERYCLHKVWYKSAGRARAACRAMEAHHGVKFEAYKCPNCQGWHVTRKRHG